MPPSPGGPDGKDPAKLPGSPCIRRDTPDRWQDLPQFDPELESRRRLYLVLHQASPPKIANVDTINGPMIPFSRGSWMSSSTVDFVCAQSVPELRPELIEWDRIYP